MPKRRKISKKTIEAIVELLERIENELPGGIVEVSDDSEEEEVDDGSYMSVDVEVEAVEVAIDGAISEMLDDGLLPKRGSGYYTLSLVFETIFGEGSEISELADDLETVLSGYRDTIIADDVDLALSTIDEIKKRIHAITSKTADI